jgi:hypothetical protein
MTDIEADVNFLKLKMEVEKERSLSVRDQFAMAALTGLLANPKLQPEIAKTGGAYGGWIEGSAWSWADAMMEKRK